MFTVDSYLYYPTTIGEGHNIPLFPEESGVRPLDHLKLAEQLHGIHFQCGFVPHLQNTKREKTFKPSLALVNNFIYKGLHTVSWSLMLSKLFHS